MAYYGTYKPFLHIVYTRRIPGVFQLYTRRLSLLYTSVYHTFCMVIDVSCQTDTNFDALPAVKRENEILRKEVYDLHKQITYMTEESMKFIITEATFSNHLKFYTGK